MVNGKTVNAQASPFRVTSDPLRADWRIQHGVESSAFSACSLCYTQINMCLCVRHYLKQEVSGQLSRIDEFLEYRSQIKFMPQKMIAYSEPGGLLATGENAGLLPHRASPCTSIHHQLVEPAVVQQHDVSQKLPVT